jgi:hypothetical protein
MMLLLLCLPATAWATDGTAIASGNWSAAGTWSGGTKPSAGGTATLTGYNVTLDTDPLCATITGGTLTVSSNKSIAAAVAWYTNLVVSAGNTLTLTGNHYFWSGTVSGGGTITTAGSSSIVRAIGCPSFAVNIAITSGNYLLLTSNATSSGAVTIPSGAICYYSSACTTTVLSGGSFSVSSGGSYYATSSGTLTVNSGGTANLAAGRISGGNAPTLSQSTGANVTIDGQRVYVAGDSVDPGAAYVLPADYGGPATYTISGSTIAPAAVVKTTTSGGSVAGLAASSILSGGTITVGTTSVNGTGVNGIASSDICSTAYILHGHYNYTGSGGSLGTLTAGTLGLQSSDLWTDTTVDTVTGTLAVAGSNLVYGNTVHGVAGNYYPPSNPYGVTTDTTYGVGNATRGLLPRPYPMAAKSEATIPERTHQRRPRLWHRN